MERYSILVEGVVTIIGKKYNTLMKNDLLIVKGKLKKEEKISILYNMLEFTPTDKDNPVYYLCLDKVDFFSYSNTSYHILLSYTHFKDSKVVWLEIISKGFINSVNDSSHNSSDVFYNIKNNLEKEYLETEVDICNKEYKASFINCLFRNSNNFCPVDFSTALKLVPKSSEFVDEIINIYKFAIKFLQFITLDTYSLIDGFYIHYENDAISEIEINETIDCDTSNDRFLYLACLGQDINKVISAFPNAITQQHNLYYFKKGWVYEFDVVRMSGTFEGVFDENISKTDKYRIIVQKNKKAMHYNELKDILSEFKAKYNLKNNADFTSCFMMFEKYGGTLKNKLEFVLDDFCETMKFTIVNVKPFYSALKFEDRIKKFRNAICHGLKINKINQKEIVYDTLLLQELVYFMLLKYKLNLKSYQVEKIINISFKNLNEELSFFKIYEENRIT